MKYVIKIEYTESDSFTEPYPVTRNMEPVWEDLSTAKENLVRIKEHYEYYRECNRSYPRKTEAEFKAFRAGVENKPWFFKKKGNYMPAEYTIVLKLDDGTEHQYHTFWCGYFERLTGAEIIPEPYVDTDMRITF